MIPLLANQDLTPMLPVVAQSSFYLLVIEKLRWVNKLQVVEKL